MWRIVVPVYLGGGGGGGGGDSVQYNYRVTG